MLILSLLHSKLDTRLALAPKKRKQSGDWNKTTHNEYQHQWNSLADSPNKINLQVLNCTCSFIKYTISFFVFFSSFFVFFPPFLYKVNSLLNTSEHALCAKRLVHVFSPSLPMVTKLMIFIIFSLAFANFWVSFYLPEDGIINRNGWKFNKKTQISLFRTRGIHLAKWDAKYWLN